MKRAMALGLALVVVLAMGAMPAMGDGVDLAGMTMVELVALKQSIDDEMAGRVGANNAMLYAGLYEVGVEIEPGRYNLTCVTAYGGGDSICFTLYRNTAMFEAEDEYLLREYVPLGQTISLELEEDMALQVEEGDGFLERM